MELQLFEFIEQVIQLYEIQKPSFDYSEKVLKEAYTRLFSENSTSIVGIHTRVKSVASLKEKLLRNKFYLQYDTPEDALAHLHDIVGITVECRFIRNETELYKSLLRYFDKNTRGLSECYQNPDITLNLNMLQPQVQRNGFAIFRIDGTYRFNGINIGYELQIKALVHRFWSEIEHEVIYKNSELITNTEFLKEILGSVRDSLDVVDHQLEIIYKEISTQSSEAQIGMDERGFKTLAASSINELVNRKMKDSVGFTTDFRKDAGILAQYIYIRHFINGTNNEVKMVEFLEHLNILSQSAIDFKAVLEMEEEYRSGELFTDRLIEYFLSQINTNFEWHAFFTILFAVQEGRKVDCLSDFADMIRLLLIQPSWFEKRFDAWTDEERCEMRDYWKTLLSDALIRVDSPEIIHEEKLLKVMNLFRTTVEVAETTYASFQELQRSGMYIEKQFHLAVSRIFH